MFPEGVSGGAAVPPLTGAVGDWHNMNIAMVVPLAFFVATLTYALAVNFAPRYVRVVDAYHESTVGTRGTAVDEEKVADKTIEDVSPNKTQPVGD